MWVFNLSNIFLIFKNIQFFKNFQFFNLKKFLIFQIFNVSYCQYFKIFQILRNIRFSKKFQEFSCLHFALFYFLGYNCTYDITVSVHMNCRSHEFRGYKSVTLPILSYSSVIKIEGPESRAGRVFEQ